MKYLRPEMIPMPWYLRAVRVAMGLSMEGLARKIGVALPTVQRWETGKSKPTGLGKTRLLRWICNTPIEVRMQVAKEGPRHE